MPFKVGDVISKTEGSVAVFSVVAIFKDPFRYKLTRLDNGVISELPFGEEYKYKVAEMPNNLTYYRPGQVLLKKQGAPQIGLVCKTTIGADGVRHQYDIAIFTPQGEQVQRINDCSQKEVLEQFEIDNFKWVIMYGDPKRIIQKALQTRINRLQRELNDHTEWLNSLTYFDKILEQEGYTNSKEEEELE